MDTLGFPRAVSPSTDIITTALLLEAAPTPIEGSKPILVQNALLLLGDPHLQTAAFTGQASALLPSILCQLI